MALPLHIPNFVCNKTKELFSQTEIGSLCRHGSTNLASPAVLSKTQVKVHDKQGHTMLQYVDL
jgi:hypothetical protein